MASCDLSVPGFITRVLYLIFIYNLHEIKCSCLDMGFDWSVDASGSFLNLGIMHKVVSFSDLFGHQTTLAIRI
jgi:hypothetical protein